MVMRIDDEPFRARVPCKVNLCNSIARDEIYVIHRIKPMIEGRNIDVVDVEQNSDIGKFANFREKLPLGHFIHGKLRIATDIFHS